MKRIEEICEDDFHRHRVWEFVGSIGQLGETMVKPVMRLPTDTLLGRVAATKVTLADGEGRWALLGNVDLTNSRTTLHILTLTVFHKGRRFTLARYHDWDYIKRGPEALAALLGKPVEHVFPIRYDISDICVGENGVLTGSIEREPKEKLSRSDIISIAVGLTRQARQKGSSRAKAEPKGPAPGRPDG